MQQFSRNGHVTIGNEIIHPRYVHGHRPHTEDPVAHEKYAFHVQRERERLSAGVQAHGSAGVLFCAMCRFEDVCTEPGKRRVMRPVIEVPGRILTRINPHKVETTMIMHIRPGWEDLRNFIRGSPANNGGCASSTPTCSVHSFGAIWHRESAAFSWHRLHVIHTLGGVT